MPQLPKPACPRAYAPQLLSLYATILSQRASAAREATAVRSSCTEMKRVAPAHGNLAYGKEDPVQIKVFLKRKKNVKYGI